MPRSGRGGLAGGDGREVAWTCCHATLRGRAVDGAAAGWREGEGASDRTSMVGSLISAGLPLRPSSLASPCSLAPGGWSCVKGREGGEVRGGGFLKDGLRRGARRRRAREGGVSRVPGPVSPSSSSSRPRVAPASAPIIAARRGRRYPYRWRKRWTQEEHLDPPAWGHGHR
jgi:hypothetical protein